MRQDTANGYSFRIIRMIVGNLDNCARSPVKTGLILVKIDRESSYPKPQSPRGTIFRDGAYANPLKWLNNAKLVGSCSLTNRAAEETASCIPCGTGGQFQNGSPSTSGFSESIGAIRGHKSAMSYFSRLFQVCSRNSPYLFSFRDREMSTKVLPLA